jgi:hypothetical protein
MILASLLSPILTAVRAIGTLVLWALMTGVNSIIAALGAAIALVFSLLPSMPAPPDSFGGQYVGWLNWLMPIGPLVAAFALFVSAYVAFLAIRVIGRWVKAL